ncbi:hypothetical protein BB558_004254 [Smittium angustum]|nr:hypothetical protein BB558_004254 [Smittium angustum]
MGYISSETIHERLADQLRASMKDKDPYVRKTAALSLLKLFKSNTNLFEEDGDLLDLLKKHLLDENPSVVANSVAALMEISFTFPQVKLVFNPAAARKLAVALNECNEWSQVHLLKALMYTVPNNSEEAMVLIERILPRFQHSNTSVVLGAIRLVCYLMNFLDDKDELIQLCNKITPPLVTLLGSGPQVQLVTLKSILLLHERWPHVMQGQIQALFCKYSEPNYVRIEKLELLVRLVDDDNANLVLMELAEYSLEQDGVFVKKVIESVGRIALKISSASDECVAILMKVGFSNREYAIESVTVELEKILIKYPNRYKRILNRILGQVEFITEPNAKAAIVWMCGVYIKSAKNAEAILKDISSNFINEKSQVQLALLTALAKLFVYKPSSLNTVISSVLTVATDKAIGPDVRDRAFFYWRLFSLSPESAKKVIMSKTTSVTSYVEGMNLEKLDCLLLQLGTLSSVYYIPQHIMFKGTKELRLPDSSGLVKYRFLIPRFPNSYNKATIDDNNKVNEIGPLSNDSINEMVSPSMPEYTDDIINFDPYSALADIPIGDFHGGENSPNGSLGNSPGLSMTPMNARALSQFTAIGKSSSAGALTSSKSSADQLAEMTFSSLINSKPQPNTSENSGLGITNNNIPTINKNSPLLFSDLNPLNSVPGLNRYPTMPLLTAKSSINLKSESAGSSFKIPEIPSIGQQNAILHSSRSYGNMANQHLLAKATTNNMISSLDNLNLSSQEISANQQQVPISNKEKGIVGLGVTSNANSTLTDSRNNTFTNSSLQKSAMYGSQALNYGGYQGTTVTPNLAQQPSTKNQKVLDSQQTNGLEVYGVFERVGDIQLTMTFVNNSTQMLTDFAIQFNLNTFGLVPKSPMQIPNNCLLQGQMVSVALPLQVGNPTMIKQTFPVTNLQIALKCSLGVFYFQMNYSFHILLLQEQKQGQLEQNYFLQLWQELQNQSLLVFSGVCFSSVDGIRNKLNMNGIFTVAQRKTDQFYVFYTSSKLFDQSIFVSEIKLSLDFIHAQVTSKSLLTAYTQSHCEAIKAVLTTM